MESKKHGCYTWIDIKTNLCLTLKQVKSFASLFSKKMKRLNMSRKKKNLSVQDRSKTQYTDTVGRMLQKITSPEVNPGNYSTG